MLDILGLDDVTYAVYRQWLLGPGTTFEAIGDAVGQPPAAVRRATERLVGLALLIPSADDPGHLHAVPPEGALERLLEQQHEQLLHRHEQLLRRHEQVARARAQISSLVVDYTRRRQGGSDADVDRIDGADAVRAQLVGLVTRAEREIVTLRTEALVSREVVTEVLPAELRALRRRVAIRGIWPPSVQSDASVAGYAREVAGKGLDVRVGDDQPAADLMVVDDWICLVLAVPGSLDSGAMLVRSPALVQLAVSLFGQVWDGAPPLSADDDPYEEADDGLTDGPAGKRGTDPTESELALLRVLSLGAKDEAAARQLGVSVRTVRRMIADLMREADARSRFQAGVIAAQRGWI